MTLSTWNLPEIYVTHSLKKKVYAYPSKKTTGTNINGYWTPVKPEARKSAIGLFFLALSWVMVLAPFPTIFFLMWNRNLQLTRNLKEAMEMNGHLSRRISPEVGIASLEDKVFSSEEALVFAGGTKEMLEVKAGDFLYAEAKGNYVKVGYRSDSDKEKKITWRLLRATMKQAEEAVSACPFIIRCHRAFLVNIRMVVKVDGNSQGYKLNLEGCEEEVPVSRAYAKEVKALIENRTKS